MAKGSIFISKTSRRPKHRRLNMTIAMTDKFSIDRFHKAVGVGTVVKINRLTKSGKTVWRWQTQSVSGVKYALQQIWPFLGINKRYQATKALEERQIYEDNQKTYRRTSWHPGR